MNRFRSGMVPLFALLVLVGCSSEPTGDLRDGPTELVASPTQLVLELGGVKNVEVGSVDAQGNPIDLNYEVTGTGAGITVRRDSSFLPIFVDDSTLQAPAVGPRFRFIVEGTAYAASSFTVSAGGLELVVPVRVVPQTGFAGTFDKPVAVLGDTITLTAAPGTAFTETAELRILGVPDTILVDTVSVDPILVDTIPVHPVIVARGENGSSLSFVAPPNVNGPLIITEVTSVSAPDLVFSPATDTPLQTPLIDTVDVTYSTTTPALNQTVTMTVPEPLINLVVDSIIFPGQVPGSREGDPQNIEVAPDSNSLTFTTPPNIDGSGTVVNFAFPGGFRLALPTQPTVTAPNIGTTFDATFSNQTPALLEPVTLTAPAGFSFDLSLDTLVSEEGDTTITSPVAIAIGGEQTIIQSISASSITLLPIPGTAGVASVDGVVPDLAPSNILTMLTIQTVTVPPLVPLEGTDDFATAPLIPTPGVTVDAGTFDAAGCAFGDLGATCQVYRISFAAPTTLTFTLTGANAADLGLYFLNAADLSEADQACDSLGRAAPPESCSLDFAAGDYIMQVINFGPLYPELDPDPPFIEIDIN
jgi:hypothetical protein